jgi:hypothetical protein
MSTAIESTRIKRAPKASSFSDQFILQIAHRDRNGIVEWVRTIAEQNGIATRRLPNDRFTRAVSRLSDGVVDLDSTEEVLIALGRAGILSSYQRGLLQVHYLR